MKRKPATLANRGSPKTWVCTQQHGDALELLDEPRCDGTPSFAPVEAGRVTEIALRASVQRKGQSSSARNLAMASGPETGDEAPLSSSASRSAASLSRPHREPCQRRGWRRLGRAGGRALPAVDEVLQLPGLRLVSARQKPSALDGLDAQLAARWRRSRRAVSK